MGAFYCSVCRKTDFSGKGHIYGKSHQSQLKVTLAKFTNKVKEARRSMRSPQVEKYSPSHELKFWCYCCSLEVPRHVTDGNMTVLHGGLLEHMSTPEHRKNTHKFWWENKADPKLRDKFIIAEEDTESFKAEVSKALEQFEEKEDVFIKEQAAVIRSQQQNRLMLLHSLSEVCFPAMLQAQSGPEHVPAAELEQCSSAHIASSHSCSNESEEKPGPSHQNSSTNSHQREPGEGLTFIGHQDSSRSGNIHTGAVPPWLLDEADESSQCEPKESGPSLQGFLKHKEQEKLKKLPPNRVGANFDHSSRTTASWLPSFGRVWNSGRRWQSRHQFREEETTTRRKRKWQDDGKPMKKPKDLSNGQI